MASSSNPQSAAREGSSPWGVELWILGSALVTAAGWLLSAIHQLNARGYACVLILVIIVLFRCEQRRNFADFNAAFSHRIFRRVRRPLPFGFFILALIALTGGILYTPGFYDALAYRLPRVLHWLAQDQWHWVHTAFPRLNVRACGQEWLLAPILALTKSAHATFLLSFISFLLLPGLFYSVFIRFGIKPRIAWHWMWICATGYGYACQAGGLANDIFGAPFVLAAFDFALRLRQSGRLKDLWFFMLATALMSGAKASNVPLLLAPFLVALPRWRLLFAKPVPTFFVIVLAALASFLPTAFFNAKYGGDWSGMNLEGPMKPYFSQLGINSVTVVLLNFAPPIFPFASQWSHFLSATLGLDPDIVHCWTVPELSTEGGTGLGFGVCVLLTLSLVATFIIRRRNHSCSHATGEGTGVGVGFAQTRSVGSPSPGGEGRGEGGRSTEISSQGATTLPWFWKLVVWSPYFSLFVFCIKAQAVFSVGRLLTPYYAALVVPPLLFGFDESLLRRRWWKALVALVFALVIVLMILEPGRPLWPAQTILGRLKQSHPNSRAIARAYAVYAVYAHRTDAFAPLVAKLPADANLFGMITFDDPETSLWWPLGSRRIEHVTPEDTLADLQARGIKYVLAPDFCGALTWHVEDVIRKFHAEVVAKVPLSIRAEPGPVDWYVLKIRSS